MADDDLREEVRRLRKEVDALQRRVSTLEESTDASEAEERPHLSTSHTGDTSPGAAPESTAGRPADPTDEEPDSGRDWERTIGVHWLGVAGALALVVGVVFFVRLAIEMGLLGPLGRVTVGTLGGIALFGGGRYAAVRQGYRRWGRITAGAGIAITYFSVYAAYGFEGYRDAIGTPLWAVLVALTLLVVAVVAVSLHDGAPVLVGEAFLFGYVTAYLSTDAATLVLTPAYVLLLSVALVGLTSIRPWVRTTVSGVLAANTVVLLWALEIDPSDAALIAVALAVFSTFLAGNYLLRRHRPGSDSRWYTGGLAALTVSNALFATVLVDWGLEGIGAETELAGIGAIGIALVLVGFSVLTSSASVDRDRVAAGTAVVLFAVGLWVLLEVFPATVGLLSVIGAAVAIARIDDEPAFRAGAHLVAGGLLVKLLAVDARELAGFDSTAPLAALTGRPMAFLLSIAVFYGLAWLFASRRIPLVDYERHDRIPFSGIYGALATLLSVVILGLELSGFGVSIAWGLLGFALLAVGLYADVRGARFLGIGVFALATLKVFVYDTRDLDTLARTLSFLVVGALLLAASYAYTRSRGDIDDIDIELPR